MSASRPRVAILGIHLESNAFAPVSTEEDFRKSCYFEADASGLTSPVLERFSWKRLPRPVWPLDLDTRWLAPAIG